ncbi:MAG: thioredoxin [Chitinophagales bacterium]|nr:thioredoxin [Chitinophagales bacterium]MDW8393481.1 thioredoxin [Chitinophagales bacterium]
MSETFSEIIRSDKLTLVDFYAEWCGPCKMMKPVLEELKKRIGDRARILKVDVDQSPLVASAYHIQGVPTLMLFRNGQVLWRQAGVVPVARLEELISRFATTDQATSTGTTG